MAAKLPGLPWGYSLKGLSKRLSERLFISVSAAAAVTCAVIMALLLMQTNRTRVQLQNDGVVEFNFVQQLDHNFDGVSIAALSLVVERAERAQTPQPLTSDSDLVRRFDVLYSSTRLLGDESIGSLMEMPATPATLEAITTFIAENDIKIAPGSVLSDVELREIAAEGQGIAHEVYELGLLMYQRKSQLRDEVSARMNWLSRASWFFGGTFFIAGLTLYMLLTRASRRAGRLFHQAHSSQRQLETALEELTTGDIQRKSQNRFLAAATHDLRQPLQAMQYYIAALEPHIANEKGHEILGKVGRSTEAAQGLLTSLLDISKLDAGVLEPATVSVDLDALLVRLHDDYLAEAQDRGIELSIEATGVVVQTDPQFLERILVNLLSNAINHTEAGSVSIDVDSTRSDSEVSISVKDTGVGIPEHELEAIFNEYYQVPDEGSLSASDGNLRQGMGLGLSIVKRLTRLIQVPLEVSSRIGRGTRFTITLPVAVNAGDAAVPQVTKQAVSGDGLDGLYIMIIDDDPSVRDGVTTLLKQRGCNVLVSSGIEEALDTLVESESMPDLILADYQLLNGATGVEAIERVRDEVNEEVPAIVVTGDTSPDRLREARERGHGLLHKPVGSAALFEVIRNTVHGAPDLDNDTPESLTNGRAATRSV